MGFNKKVLSKAVSELGKAKAPGKPKDIITDPAGQWKYPGQKTRIPGNDITMQDVPYPVWAQPNVGPGSMMQPNQDYNFPGASYVDETPMAKKGGSKLGTINLNPNPLSHYELNYGFNLPTEENGGEADYEDLELTDEEIQAYRDGGYVVEELPKAQVGGPQNTSGPRAEEIPANVNAMNAMMKARMATDAEFGNPAARRMTSPNPKTYDFGNGDLGTHFMASMGNQAVPLLQDKGDDELEYNENPPPSKEDMNFRTPEEAQYFAEHYKEVAPMMRGFKQGGFVQHELVKAQKGKTVTHTNRDDYNKAFAAEADSLSLYNDSRHAFNKFTRAGDRFNTNLNPEQWKKASNEYDKLLDLQEKKWHTFPYKNGDVSQYIPGYTANYKYKGPRSGLIIKPVGVEKFYREGYDFPKFKKPVIHNIIQEPKNEITPLKNIPYQQSIRPEQQIIPAAPYKKPIRYSGPRYGTLAGDENLNLPEGYTQEQREAARRKRDSDASQQKNLKYQEQEKAKINSRLKPAGLTENFRQGGILDSYQKKGQVQPKAAVKGKPYNFYTSPLGQVVGQGLAIQKKQALDRYNNAQNNKSNVGWSNEKSVTPSKKKPVQPTVQQKAAQKTFDKKFKVTDKDAYTKVKDKIAASQKDYIASGKKNGYAITQKDLDDIENMHWKSAGVGQIGEPDMMQATPTQSNTNRAWEYVTNPFTAAEYAISGGGAENMPHNINEMRMAGIDPGVVQGRNLVGNTLNSTLNLFDAGDKTARNVYRGNYGAAALEAMRFIPGGGLLDDAIRLGVKPGAKYLGKSLNKLSKYVPENVPVNTGSTLNAGISPQLIKNTIGTGNKVGANILNKAYISPFFSKAFNRYSPLNLIKGYGSKLEGAVRPLGNVLGKSIKNNKLTGSKPLFGKAKELSTQVGKTDASNIYAAKFDDAVEGSNIRLGEANPQGRFSRKSNATFPIQTKAGVNRYDLPISDPGVALHRRLPFSNKYVPIDKQKLMNNKFQWSTTGAGLQNVAEKYGKGVVGSTLGYGAYNAYNYDKNKPETFATPEEIELANKYNSGQFAESDVPSRAEMFKRGAKEAYESPLDYAKNPYFVNDIYQGLNPTQEEKNGGSIESWEDDLDEEEIILLKEAGFIVEELK